MARVTIKPSNTKLGKIAVGSGFTTLLWIWVSALALRTEGLSPWFVFPASLLCAVVAGWVCLWAIKRRASDEPAIIIDEFGLYDNVSIIHAGRVKWHDMERIWLAGPKWMQFLCILPDNMRPYLEQQDDFRALVMRVNNSILGAPVIIPMAIFEISPEEAWDQIALVASQARMTTVTEGIAVDA